MRSPRSAAGVLLCACLLAAPAAPLSLSKNLSTQADGDSLLLQVQHRRHGGGGYRGGGGGGDGGAIAAGVVGGLILGAVIASEAQRQNAVNYCAQRFRSYDPGSGTYVGRDGRRHSCP
jgi:hypothetical protein